MCLDKPTLHTINMEDVVMVLFCKFYALFHVPTQYPFYSSQRIQIIAKEQSNMFPDHAYQKVVLPLYIKSKGYEPSLKVKRLTQELLCPCLLSEMSLPHLSKWRFLRQIYPLQVEVGISEVRRCSSSFSEQLNFPVNSHAQMPLH